MVFDRHEIDLRILELDPCNNKLIHSLDDYSIAVLFNLLFSEKLKFNATSGGWWFYDGAKWSEDVSSKQAENTTIILYESLLKYIGVKVDIDPGFIKNVARIGTRGRRMSGLADASAVDNGFFKMEDLDTNENYFNCENGTLDLETLEFKDHDSTDMLSKMATVSYNPDAKSPLWEKYINDVMMGNPEKINYLQKVLGYSLLADPCEEKAFLLYGPSTRNGKTTLVDVMGAILGSYASKTNPEILIKANVKNGEAPSPEKASWREVRFLYTSEFPKRALLDEGLFKDLTGRGIIKARELHKKPFEFKANFALFIDSNYLPVITDDSVFKSNRVQVIPFDKHFTEEEIDPTLKRKLTTDENKSGILNWLLEGLRKYREEGLIAPKEINDAIEEYKRKSDKVLMFFEEKLEPSEDGRIKGSDIYKAYTEWCKVSGLSAEGKQNFFEALSQRGLLSKNVKINGMNCNNAVVGYKWNEFEDAEETAF